MKESGRGRPMVGGFGKTKTPGDGLGVLDLPGPDSHETRSGQKHACGLARGNLEWCRHGFSSWKRMGCDTTNGHCHDSRHPRQGCIRLFCNISCIFTTPTASHRVRRRLRVQLLQAGRNIRLEKASPGAVGRDSSAKIAGSNFWHRAGARPVEKTQCTSPPCFRTCTIVA